MDKKFTSGDVPLVDLLNQARSGALQLPDFQRGWVWDDNHISSLLASISMSYPIGAVMTLQTGNPDVRFKPRLMEGVELAAPQEPEFLLLDGQQRTTSLYLALRSQRPVPTRDSRNNSMLRRYFADIMLCIDPEQDREDAIFSVPADGLVKTFRGEVTLDVSNRRAQITAHMFPLDIVLDFSEVIAWQMQYLSAGPPDEMTHRIATWTAFIEAVINPFQHYSVPLIQLSRATPKEAVCQVFEKVNTGGVSLTVFELLTATFAADNFNLRDDWDRRLQGFKAYELLELFKETDFLQIITLMTSWTRRTRFLATNSGDERVPAVTCKRKDVLKLSLQDYNGWADAVTKALPRAVRFLHGEHVFKARDLPYSTQLVPLTAIFVAFGDKGDSHGVAQMLRQWYWCGVFGEMYGGATETRFANDLQDVVSWVNGGEEPRTVRESQFQAERLLNLRTRNSAAYKGLYAQQMARGGRDFRTGATIDVHAYLDEAIDVHHIFPQKWCIENGVPANIMNSIINKTTIDATTNRRIGGSAPSKYLSKIERDEKIAEDELDAILRSHDIDPLALRRDDFGAFFNARLERLVKQIEDATSKPVNRSASGPESPYSTSESDPEQAVVGIRQVIASGESKVVEFKSTGRKNLRTGEKDAAMEWSVVKSLAGFMNGHGGTLLVGIGDDGSVVGIEEDYPFVAKGDRDGWELWLATCVATVLGKVAAADLTTTLAEVDGRVVARIDVGPSARPVFAVPPKGERKPVFLVRINNSTQELGGQDAHEFQRTRWPN